MTTELRAHPFLHRFRATLLPSKNALSTCELTGDLEGFPQSVSRTENGAVASRGTKHTSVDQETTDDS